MPPPSRPRPAWPHVANLLLALWLIATPPTLGYVSLPVMGNDIVCGVALLICSLLASRHAWVTWVSGMIGVWLMTAPLLFWTGNAAAYNNDTLVGALVVVFAVVVPRLDENEPHTLPPGWSYNPSAWPQRLPIVVLALVGFFLSRYMAAFQLGHTPRAWDPFFGDGTERVLTSDISQLFPVSDAGLGALSYLLDAVAGLIGGRRRWRTMPWMVLLFGFFIIPPGVTSIVLVILQPVSVGAWCTLCLIAAVVMLMMVPPALDEVIATAQFLQRVRRRRGNLWRALWFGEGDEADEPPPKQAATPSRSSWSEMIHGIEIFSTPWPLLGCTLVGVWLMAAPAVLGMSEAAASNNYIAGAAIATIAFIAGAEPVRALRFLNVLLGAWLLLAAWMLDGATSASRWSDVVSGLVLIALSLPRGKVEDRYGTWDRWIV